MSNPLRVLQICPHASAPFGELMRGYALGAIDAGLEIHTVFIGDESSEDVDRVRDAVGPGRVAVLGLKTLSKTREGGRRLRAALDEFGAEADDFDLVLCHRYRSYRIARAARLSARKMAVIAHEYGMLDNWRRQLDRLLYARNTLFGGVSPGVAKPLARQTGRCLVLPNVLDLERLDVTRLSRDAARAELAIPRDAFAVGVVGRLHYKKRPELALAAFQQFAKKEPQADLTFVGSGDEAIAATLSAGGARLAGALPDAARYMPAFDVLLHAGAVESFSMVCLEAMASGVAVVACGAGPEHVLGSSGFYPDGDDADAFAAALERARDAHPGTIASAGRARAERLFSIPAVGEALVALVKFVAEEETDPFYRFV